MIMIFFQKLLMHFYPPRRHKMGLVELEFCHLLSSSDSESDLQAQRSALTAAQRIFGDSNLLENPSGGV